MPDDSVGRIGLDLVLDQKKFDKQLNGIAGNVEKKMSGIKNTVMKVGATIAAGFAVKKLVDFGKECVNLGSDLAEVQNVVDVVFTTMSAKVDKFAKSAAASYGLSETMAKKFTGTYGAMAKAFGFTEAQAYDMSTTMTALAGDVASFYNISQDEAYTKLKSVFSGETETLKDLGIVMTQTALDAYALANGYGKTTQKMTEAEKVALRYKFVQDQLASAQGDFTRTADGWANQSRLLTLQLDSLKATIGQGLINALAPALKALNSFIAKLQAAADAFKTFTEKIFGSAGGSSAVSDAADAAGDLSGAADSAADGMDKTEKAAKKVKKALAGFDELNILNSSSDDTDTSSALSGIPSTEVPKPDNSSLKETDGLFNNIQKKLEKINSQFGFDKAVANIKKGINSVDFSAIKKNFSSISKSLEPIAKAAFSGVAKVAKSKLNLISTVAGGVISVTGKQLQTVSGGIAKWLDKDKNRIAGFIDTVSTNMAKGFDNLAGFFDTVFGELGSSIDRMRPRMEEAISGMLGGLTTLAGSIGTVASDTFSIFTGSCAQWAEDNKEAIGGFFDDVQSMGADVMTLIGTVSEDIGGKLSEFWENGGSGIFEGICKAFTDLGTIVLQVWEEWIKPFWDNLVSCVTDIWNNSLSPLIDKAIGFFSKISEAALMLWNNVLQPLVSWIISEVAPTFQTVFKIVGDVFRDVFSVVSGVIGGIWDALSGLIDFLVGVFTGDWEKAWSGIQNFFKGIWDAIYSVVRGAVNLIIDGINMLWTGIYSAVRGIIDGIGGIAGAIGDIFGQDWHFSMPKEPPLIPKLAKGGLVKSPTLAIVGDNPNAGRDPEVVAPLSKLQGMVGSTNDPDLLREVLRWLIKIYDALQNQEINLTNITKIDSEELERKLTKVRIRKSRRYAGGRHDAGYV